MIIFAVQVKPNAKRQEIQTDDAGRLLARIESPPVDGKANAELIKRLADKYGVPNSRITIKSGTASRLKPVEIDDGL